MWKDLFDLVRQTLRLTEDSQQTKTELKELQREVRDLARKAEREALDAQHKSELQFAALLARIERQDDEIKRLRDTLADSQERETKNRQMLLLEIENKLLKAQRQLPAAPSPIIKPGPETDLIK
jgi:hypothetical protein